MPHLFSPLDLRDLTLKNRIVLSPMAMYSAGTDGRATDFHLVHLGARALGGVGLLLTEVVAVEPRGRISEADLGLWCAEQVAPLRRIVDFVHEQGAAIGIQLGHAGRKAWTAHKGRGPEPAVGPSSIPFDTDFLPPYELTSVKIADLVQVFAAATRRALVAGFDLVEIHSAHGYLLHSFVSPLSNRREDDYGGSPENRSRLLWQVAEAVRSVWPDHLPVFTRISASDWHPQGLTVADWEPVVAGLQARGIDLIDCSSGGVSPEQVIPIGPGYQLPFSAHIRSTTGVPTAAVGLITTPEYADAIIRNGDADLVAMAREFLRHPQWPLDAARILGHDVDWPRQYVRGKV